jgi:ABC-type Fe3+/spermidine/putrescine transport system ATPase subunit
VALGRALAVDPELLLLDEPLSALDAPLRRQLRRELMAIVREWRKATVLVTHDLSEALQLADRVVLYESGRVVQAAPKAELLSAPASEQVAQLLGVRNILRGVVLKAAPDRIQLRWRGQTLEAVNSPSHSYLPDPGAELAFFIRPEHARLIRKDRGPADALHHMNLMSGRVVREEDWGMSWMLYFQLDEPGAPARGDHDLEIEVPRLVYEILDIDRDRHWQLSIHRGSIHVLPS